MNNFIVNSKEYWDFRFDSDWENYNGSMQTEFFAKLLLKNLPPEIKKELTNLNYSVLDFGCAKGQLCNEIYKICPHLDITGLDFSEAAIKHAKSLYPYIKFRTSPLLYDLDLFDIILCSNTLEHFENPYHILELFSVIAKKYLIILVPYKDLIKHDSEHVYRFDESSFKEEMFGFVKIHEHIEDTTRSGFWNGEQILVIYKKN